MATTLHIAGPSQIKIGGTVLGFSDNDNLPTIQFTDHHHEVKTVLSGNVPEALVLTGASARISVSLVKWDDAVLSSTLADQRGAVGGNSTVGRVLAGTSNTFTVEIESIAGTQSYLFGVCYFQSDSMTDNQWGNRERVLTLNFSAIPDSSNVLYTYTA